MNNEKLIPYLADKLQKDFRLETKNLPVHFDLHQIKEHLKKRINEYLNGDLEKFMNILYMIDVDENRVREIFSSKLPPELLADQLADLIIERQLKKIQTQILYREGKL